MADGNMIGTITLDGANNVNGTWTAYPDRIAVVDFIYIVGTASPLPSMNYVSLPVRNGRRIVLNLY